MTTTLTNIPEERLDILSTENQASQAAQIVAKAKAAIKSSRDKNNLQFPYHTFPKAFTDILDNFQESSGLPKEYYYGYCLGAVSGLIGNKYRIKFKTNYRQSPMLYMALVGPPSVGKTPVMNQVLRPVYNLENEYQLEHKVKMQKFKQKLFELRTEKNKDEAKELENNPPIAKELIIEDTTIEYIAQALSANPNGLILLRDEIAAWVKSFDAYKSAGAETQAWLEFWNNPTLKKIGRIKGNLYIRRPFITVMGGIQPGLLKDFASGDKTENGFLARLLFVYPVRMERPSHSDNEPHESVIDAYSKLIKFIYDLPSQIAHDDEDGANGHTYSVDSYDLSLTDAARKLYVDYRNENIIEYNRTSEDSEKGLLGKSEMYALRFALILEIMSRADKDIKPHEDPYHKDGVMCWQITADTMTKAIILNNYFKDMSFKVLSSVSDPLVSLSEEEKAIYDELSPEFSTAIIKSAAKGGFDWSDSKVKRFLNNQTVFKKLKQGLYMKRYA